jgi:hypothetical protein
MWDKAVGRLTGPSRVNGNDPKEHEMNAKTTKAAKDNGLAIGDVLDFLAMPASITVPISETQGTDIPVRDIFTAHPHMIRYAALAGMMGKLNNVSKGGLKAKLGRDATDKDLATARSKIVTDAWMEGNWNLSGSGPRDSITADMRDLYVSERVLAGQSIADVEKAIRGAVTAAFGKEEKATFARFLDAVATLKVKADESLDFQTVRDSIEADLRERVRADKAAKAEAEKDSPLSDVTAESLGF